MTEENYTNPIVIIDLNGGTSDELEQFYGTAIGAQFEIPDIYPEKVGCYFIGWLCGATTYYPGDSIEIYGDITLVAQWCQRDSFTVSFDLNGGEGSFPSYTAYCGDELTLPTAIPTREDATFAFWRNEYNGNLYFPGDNIVDSCESSQTLVFTAMWEVTLSFDANGSEEGEFPPLVAIENFGMVQIPNERPYKFGHNFLHWQNSKGDVVYPGDWYGLSNGSETLTAVYDEFPKYTVEFNLNGGTGDFPPISQYYTNGLTLHPHSPEKSRSNFLYWTDIDERTFYPGEEYYYNPDYVDWTPKTFTLTAVWETFDYAIYYEGLQPDFVNIGESYVITSSIPTKEGHDFLYWKNGEDTYVAGDLITPTADMHFEAVWQIRHYDIIFDTNGGEGTFPVIDKVYDEDVTIPAEIPEKEGYTFSHWESDKGAIYYPFDVYSENAGVTLHAVWEYTLTFDLDGGTGDLAPITKKEGEYTVLTEIPQKEGYHFDGFENKNGELYSRYTFEKGEDTLTAKWKEKTYTVSYNLEDGEGDFPAQTKMYFSPLTLHTATPTREGHTFIAWQEEENLFRYPEEEYTENRDITLHAIWQNDNETLILYDLSDGEGFFPMQTKEKSGGITLHAEVPTREGYAFAHWTDAEGNEYNPSDEYGGESTLFLTAVWKEIFTITFLDGDGNVIATQEKLEGESVLIRQEAPTISNHLFSYWVTEEDNKIVIDGREYSEDRNITLLPVYLKIFYMVFWNGDKIFTVEDKLEDVTFYVPEDVPEKDGYDFVCWKKRSSNEYFAPGDAYRINEDMSFDAVFVENTKKMIVYDLDGGEGNFPDQIANKEDSITIHEGEPVKEGYEFIGWCDKSEALESASSTYSLARNASYPYNVYAPGYVHIDGKILNLKALWNASTLMIINKPENNAINLEDLSYQLSVSVPDLYKSLPVTWSSSNASVAVIESNGMITTKKVGATTITASITTPGGDTYTDSFELTIDYMFKNSSLIDDVEVRRKALKRMAIYYKRDALRSWIDGGNTCIFAFEGLGEGYGEYSSLSESTKEAPPYVYHKEPYKFLNAMMVVTKGKDIVYVTRRASTLPDWRPEAVELDRTTTLKEGVYEYKTGNHQNKYIALRPVNIPWNSWYHNGTEFVPDTADGINLHATSGKPLSPASSAHSQGCQTVYWDDYIEFGTSVGFLKDIDYKKITFEKVGEYFSKVIGIYDENDPQTNGSPVQVKYILDRTYDFKNINTDYPEGVFYPA